MGGGYCRKIQIGSGELSVTGTYGKSWILSYFSWIRGYSCPSVWWNMQCSSTFFTCTAALVDTADTLCFYHFSILHIHVYFTRCDDVFTARRQHMEKQGHKYLTRSSGNLDFTDNCSLDLLMGFHSSSLSLVLMLGEYEYWTVVVEEEKKGKYRSPWLLYVPVTRITEWPHEGEMTSS